MKKLILIRVSMMKNTFGSFCYEITNPTDIPEGIGGIKEKDGKHLLFSPVRLGEYGREFSTLPVTRVKNGVTYLNIIDMNADKASEFGNVFDLAKANKFEGNSVLMERYAAFRLDTKEEVESTK